MAPKPPAAPALVVHSKPGEAEVYVDDVRAGKTSPEGVLKIPDLSPGTHRVRLSLQGYADYEQTVALAAGQPATIEAGLEAAFRGLGSRAQVPNEKTVKEILSASAPAVAFIETRDATGRPLGQGSGFVVDPSGIIATNFHVIQGAHAVEVKLKDGEVYDSTGVIDYDVRRDIAVIKIRGVRLPTLKLGDSRKVEQGDRAIAIGNPLGLEHTVSDGLVSALRILEGTRYFQISVPISPGSSGGPLFNTKGEVIGITAAAVVAEGAQSLNLALPIDYLETMLGQGVVEPKSRFDELARKYPAERRKGTEEAPSGATSQEFMVAHDHGDGFESYCIGVLRLAETGISYQGTKSAHSFEMPLEAIQEARKNAFYGAESDAFHIKLRTGTNYNFFALNGDGEAISSDPVLFAIQKALLRTKQQ